MFVYNTVIAAKLNVTSITKSWK